MTFLGGALIGCLLVVAIENYTEILDWLLGTIPAVLPDPSLDRRHLAQGSGPDARCQLRVHRPHRRRR